MTAVELKSELLSRERGGRALNQPVLGVVPQPLDLLCVRILCLTFFKEYTGKSKAKTVKKLFLTLKMKKRRRNLLNPCVQLCSGRSTKQQDGRAVV